MKAAVFRHQGLGYEDFPEPSPVDGAVPVRVRAAALTNLDISTAEGTHFLSPPVRPMVPGNECVADLPDGRRGFFPVSSIVAPHGSMADYALGRPERALRVPAAIADPLAAALGNAGLAAWLPLSWRAKLQPGETVLILGGTGASGLIAVSAARLLGAGRIIVAGRDEHALAKARALGANATISLGGGDAFDRSLGEALAGEGGIDVVLDYLNGPATLGALERTNPGGRLVQIGSALGADIHVPAQLARRKSLSILGFAYFMAPRDVQQAGYDALCEAALRDELALDLEEVPLADIAAAWITQKAGTRRRQVMIP